MNTVLALVALLLATCVSVRAQDTESSDTDSLVETSIRRKSNLEIGIGLMNASFYYDPQFKGEPIPEGGLTVSRVAFSLIVSGHIPLTTLGPLTTLWLVPGAMVSANFGKSDYDNSEAPAGFFDLSVPVYVTFGYGALRRKIAAWGFDAGIGVNLGRRFAHDAFTIAPSAMIDLSYSPKSIFHLRGMIDILPASMGLNRSYRTWSVMFIVGGQVQ